MTKKAVSALDSSATPPHRPRAWRSRAGVAILAASTMLLTACSSGEEQPGDQELGPAEKKASEYPGYLANSELTTANAGTAFGTASVASQLSARLYPGAFVSGPTGQFVPNSDLVTTEEWMEGDQRNVLYTIAEDANYSDGTPVTCDDFLLSFTAGQMQELFGSNMPMMDQVESVACAPENKKFLVKFQPGQGGQWRSMFGPGTVMPAHKIAERAEISREELVNALYSQDPSQLGRIAEIWRFAFGLEHFTPEMHVSYGPFAIDSVGEQGEVLLKRNENYYGDPAALENLVVWPIDADVAEVTQQDNLLVADAAVSKPKWFDSETMSDDFEIEDVVGDLTDSLIFSDSGVFEQQWARQAFAACIDQNEIAKVSSDASGVDVPPVYTHAVNHNDPMARTLSSVTEEHKKTDLEKAGQLSGMTIRIGYLGEDERLQAMVDSIRQQCEPAGITVEEVSGGNVSAAFLEMDPETWLPSIDAFLGPIDARTQYGVNSASLARVDELRDEERHLWEDLPGLPLSAEPHTFFISPRLANAVPYTGSTGIGWNMDRWYVQDVPESEQPSGDDSEGESSESSSAS
ncbi:ABC transporter substrate-binding protein [Corynebacterium ammoniagenes]|uniref:Dipeptide-binding protein DciAE n=1 Tax=Corynebacterium ammoniagenes TaxID=1697 RepID=A0AAV5G5A1_CORAM|nr:ABC transporter substrate-binding protein [Corynebacterium ammoniagenes]GJN42377.1 dipeptide-binding protein DciAE [Corynebacterium ammoniagenes]